MDRCDGCGFDYDLSTAPSAGPAIVAGADELAVVLRRDPSTVAQRPRPDTWSVLEYGCHVRDVLLVQRERVLSARRNDRPEFEPMGRDERVEHDGYVSQDPGAVARQLTDAAALFANVLARLDTTAWERPVVYSYPARLERTLRWVAVHTVHEVDHHLLDARRQLAPDLDGA